MRVVVIALSVFCTLLMWQSYFHTKELRRFEAECRKVGGRPYLVKDSVRLCIKGESVLLEMR